MLAVSSHSETPAAVGETTAAGPPENSVECRGDGEVVRRRLVIGGLVNDYYRKTA